MKGIKQVIYPKFRPVFLLGGLLLMLFLQACSTYSPSHAGRSYGYQPQVSSYHSGHGYYSDRYNGHRYYGNYQPGWFISAGYPGAYYGAWGHSPVAYWPSYSSVYYRTTYYPYHDPWYSSYYSHYRHPYRYGYGYGHGYPNGYRYGNRSYYGNSHSYRPPGHNQQPPQNRPDPVVISPHERRRRGASDGFNQRIDEGSRQREIHQAGRRSVTIVNEERDMSRSIGVAPSQAGDQGMTISSRSERKIRESRLEPVSAQTIIQQSDQVQGIQNANQRTYRTQPAQRPAPSNPINSGRNARAYGSPPDTVRAAPATPNRGMQHQATAPVSPPPARSEPAIRQAPTRRAPAPRNQPAYEQQLDSSSVAPTADRRQPRARERGQERQNH